MLTSMIFANKTQTNLTNIRVVIEGVNDFRPVFEQPDGYTFNVMEGIQGITVGVVEVVAIRLSAFVYKGIDQKAESRLCFYHMFVNVTTIENA